MSNVLTPTEFTVKGQRGIVLTTFKDFLDKKDTQQTIKGYRKPSGESLEHILFFLNEKHVPPHAFNSVKEHASKSKAERTGQKTLKELLFEAPEQSRLSPLQHKRPILKRIYSNNHL